MRLFELNEAFDDPYPYDFEQRAIGYRAIADLPDGGMLTIRFLPNTNEPTEDTVWEILFTRGKKGKSSILITGEGDQMKIFATVLSAVQKFIKVAQPNHLELSADKSEEERDGDLKGKGSREKLYSRLLNKYAGKWGYNFKEVPNKHGTAYNLEKKQ